MGLNYVPYERTYRGIPVVGGDFVVSTDNNGKILATSVAQTRQVKLRSVKATVSRAAARATSAHRLDTAPPSARAASWCCRPSSSRLAWQSRVTGSNGKEPSSLSVYVDAQSGKVLGTQEHVMAGNGTAAYSGPSPSTWTPRCPAARTR